MPHRRMIRKGSFGGHFDELVRHFPHEESKVGASMPDPKAMEEKRDIHALLFERAWRMDRDDRA